MIVERIQEGNGTWLNHTESPQSGGYTLCGLALEGASLPDEECHKATMQTDGIVTCPLCIAIIKHCVKVSKAMNKQLNREEVIK